ncbi:MAG: hypothetical protein IV096_16380 [Microbacterium sp.]|nr:hypothetical protein [Microbacterium sp.]
MGLTELSEPSGLPAHWSEAARDTFEDTEPELADSGAAHASLVEACELLTRAYELDAVAVRADYVTKASTGQEVLHPAVAESRLAHTAAATILARLIAAKNKGQAVVRARHGGAR